jgi:hypothetical protein
MTLKIDLSSEDESQLGAAAAMQGVSPEELASRLVHEHLPLRSSGSAMQDPSLALFAHWDTEDCHMTAAEVQQARAEFEEFKQNISAERRQSGTRIICP